MLLQAYWLVLRGHVTALTTITCQQKFIADGRELVPLVAVHVGCHNLSLMALTFLLTQMYSLNNTVLGYVVMFVRSCYCVPEVEMVFHRRS